MLHLKNTITDKKTIVVFQGNINDLNLSDCSDTFIEISNTHKYRLCYIDKVKLTPKIRTNIIGIYQNGTLYKDQTLLVSKLKLPILISIIGGGPVGLFTALSMRQKFSNIHINVYEKYTTYTRKQIVFIQSPAIKAISGSLDYSIVNELFGPSGIGCSEDNKQPKPTELRYVFCNTIAQKKMSYNVQSHIILSELENAFRTKCIKNNINIINRNINKADLDNIIKHSNIVFGADGSNSIVRDTYFKSDIKDRHVNKKPKYAMTIIYKAQAKKSFKYETNIQSRFRAFISRKNKDNTSLHYIGCQLLESEYNTLCSELYCNQEYKLTEIQSNTLSEYKKLNTIINDATLYYDISKPTYTIQLGLFKYTLHNYDPKYKKQNNTHIFLVGDSACTFSFFSGWSLSNGLMYTRQLVKSLDISNIVNITYNINNTLCSRANDSGVFNPFFSQGKQDCVLNDIPKYNEQLFKSNIKFDSNISRISKCLLSNIF